MLEPRRKALVPAFVASAAPLRAHLSTALQAATVAFVETAPPAEPSPLFSLRHLSRSLLMRAIARVLIKLAVILPLPRELQAASVLWPVSIVWSIVPSEKGDSANREHSSTSGVSARPGESSCETADPISAELILIGTASLSWGLTGTPVDKLAGVRTATLGPSIPILSLEPAYALIDEKGKTVDDIRVSYRVVPAGGEVQSPTIHVVDSAGTVLFSGPVTLAQDGSGEITIPKGQSVKATPNFIAFEVHNPDGQTSGPATGSGALAVQPPFLSELSPSRVVAGTTSVTVAIRGRNFTPNAEVGIGVDDTTSTYQAGFVSAQELRLTIPATFLSTVATLSVTVRIASLVSNAVPMMVIPPGLPPAPLLASIDPTQVVVGSDGFWLTLHGDRFDPEDSLVFADGAGAPLTTQYISPTEFRALVPPGLLVKAGQIGIRVESHQDGRVISEARHLDVLGLSGVSVTPPPVVTALDPLDVPYVPEGLSLHEVRVQGAGFQSGAQVFARVDDQSAVALSTQLTGGELLAKVPADLWRQNSVKATFSFDTAFGQKESKRTIDAFKAGIFLTELRSLDLKSINRVMPATFYDYDAGPYKKYLVDPVTARAKPDTFSRDANSFLIHVRDPRFLEPANMNVSIRSEKADGTFVDSIQKFDTKKGEPRGSLALRKGPLQYYESAQRIVAVTDAVDDGAVDAADLSGTFKFSPNDGNASDQTIQTVVGGRLRVIYKDAGFTQEAKIDVCPASIRLTIPFQLYVVDGVSANPQASIDQARAYWAQLCVDLVQVGSTQTIPDPAGTLKDLERAKNTGYFYDAATNQEVDCFNEAYDPSKPGHLPQPAVCALAPVNRQKSLRFTRESPSQDMLDLISAVPPPAGDPVLRIIVVDKFEVRAGSNERALGHAVVEDVSTVKRLEPTSASLQPLAVADSGVLFVVKDGVGQVWAHEIAHVIVGEYDARRDNPVHVDEIPNILWPEAASFANAVRVKRFNGRQIDLLYRSNRYVRYPQQTFEP